MTRWKTIWEGAGLSPASNANMTTLIQDSVLTIGILALSMAVLSPVVSPLLWAGLSCHTKVMKIRERNGD
jgi:hypothetical protein